MTQQQMQQLYQQLADFQQSNETFYVWQQTQTLLPTTFRIYAGITVQQAAALAALNVPADLITLLKCSNGIDFFSSKTKPQHALGRLLSYQELIKLHQTKLQNPLFAKPSNFTFFKFNQRDFVTLDLTQSAAERLTFKVSNGRQFQDTLYQFFAAFLVSPGHVTAWRWFTD